MAMGVMNASAPGRDIIARPGGRGAREGRPRCRRRVTFGCQGARGEPALRGISNSC